MANYLLFNLSVIGLIKYPAIISIHQIKPTEIPKDITPGRGIIPANYPYFKEFVGFDLNEVMPNRVPRIEVNNGDVVYIINTNGKTPKTIEDHRENFKVYKAEVFFED